MGEEVQRKEKTATRKKKQKVERKRGLKVSCIMACMPIHLYQPLCEFMYTTRVAIIPPYIRGYGNRSM